MSWDAFITQNLMAEVDTNGNTLTSAALVGLDGSIWAQSETFPVFQENEFDKMVEAMRLSSATAVNIAGVKYMKLYGDETVLRCRLDKTGFIARKTHQVIIIGFYQDPPVSGQTCNKMVEALADFLENQGY